MIDAATASMECVECRKVLPIVELRFLHPKRELKLQVRTDEHDFFCRPCAVEVGIDHLPDGDVEAWLNEEEKSEGLPAGCLECPACGEVFECRC